MDIEDMCVSHCGGLCTKKRQAATRSLACGIRARDAADQRKEERQLHLVQPTQLPPRINQKRSPHFFAARNGAGGGGGGSSYKQRRGKG